MFKMICPAVLVWLAACAASPLPLGSDEKPEKDLSQADWNGLACGAGDLPLTIGDRLEIEFYSTPELNRELQVLPDGSVQMPYILPVPASGRSVADLALDLKAALSDELRDPEFDLIVTEAAPASIFVDGAVESPGLHPLQGEMSVMQGIFIAGGMKTYRDIVQILVLRRCGGGEISSAGFLTRTGDFDLTARPPIWLRRFDIVYVLEEPTGTPERYYEAAKRQDLPDIFEAFHNSPTPTLASDR